MIKRLLWVVVGAAGALQADRWLRAQKARLKPSAMTTSLLDKANRRLEQNRQQQS